MIYGHKARCQGCFFLKSNEMAVPGKRGPKVLVPGFECGAGLKIQLTESVGNPGSTFKGQLIAPRPLEKCHKPENAEELKEAKKLIRGFKKK